MVITDDIKGLLTINSKKRRLDSLTDLFNRLFMVRIMLIGTLIVGLNWYKDKMQCIVPGSVGISGGFVSTACWINGLYIYKDITTHDDIGYYGIPRDINNDGLDVLGGKICATTDTSHRKVDGCSPMEKTFYIQYQFMVFVLAVLALLYYSPYVLFRYANDDIKSLNDALEDDATTAESIVDNYFKPNGKLMFRVLANFIVKILYLVVSLVGFFVIDAVLLHEFTNYGLKWANWASLTNQLAYDYIGQRSSPKPANILLPSYGLCEVHESAQDVKHVIVNKHRFVCELSQHVVYQYVFMVIWWAMVASIFVSSIGLVLQLLDYVKYVLFTVGNRGKRRVRVKLNRRQYEYLSVLKKKMSLYEQVRGMLKKDPHYASSESGECYEI